MLNGKRDGGPSETPPQPDVATGGLPLCTAVLVRGDGEGREVKRLFNWLRVKKLAYDVWMWPRRMKKSLRWLEQLPDGDYGFAVTKVRWMIHRLPTNTENERQYKDALWNLIDQVDQQHFSRKWKRLDYPTRTRVD